MSVRELLIHQPIFIGFKVDSQLRAKLESLGDADKKYVSSGSSTFLRICMVGEDRYVGKLVDGRLTTDRVEDIRRNVLSIIRKVGGEGGRMPANLQILACSSARRDDTCGSGDRLEEYSRSASLSER